MQTDLELIYENILVPCWELVKCEIVWEVHHFMYLNGKINQITATGSCWLYSGFYWSPLLTMQIILQMTNHTERKDSIREPDNNYKLQT